MRIRPGRIDHPHKRNDVCDGCDGKPTTLNHDLDVEPPIAEVVVFYTRDGETRKVCRSCAREILQFMDYLREWVGIV